MPALRHLVLVLAASALALAASGCSPDKGFPSEVIEKGDYGASWPFEADKALLTCEPGALLAVTIDGNTTVFGDASKYDDYVELVEPAPHGIDYSMFVDEARSLCH